MRNPTLQPKKPQSKEAKARQSLREEIEKVWSMVKWTLAMEVRDADELLRALRLDPDIYRTECGYINMLKVRAALANPDEYPMMPNV